MNLSELRQRLTRLDRRDKLDSMLASVDEGVPWNDFVWMLQFPAYLGTAILIAMMVKDYADTRQDPADVDVLVALGMAVLCVLLRFLHPLLRNRMQRLRRRLRRRAPVLPSAVVQAHSSWGEDDRWYWGTVVLSFDPVIYDEPQRLREIARRLWELKQTDRGTLPRAHADLAWMLYHELGPCSSLPVPEDLADGLEDCRMVAVRLPPDTLMWDGMPMVLALRDSNDPAACAVLPQAVLEG